MQWPEALHTNSFSVQLFMGSVAGTEVPEVVVEIVGKFPLKNKPTKCWAVGLRHSSFVMISPLASPTLCQGCSFAGTMAGWPSWMTWTLPSRNWIEHFLSGRHQVGHANQPPFIQSLTLAGIYLHLLHVFQVTVSESFQKTDVMEPDRTITKT